VRFAQKWLSSQPDVRCCYVSSCVTSSVHHPRKAATSSLNEASFTRRGRSYWKRGFGAILVLASPCLASGLGAIKYGSFKSTSHSASLDFFSLLLTLPPPTSGLSIPSYYGITPARPHKCNRQLCSLPTTIGNTAPHHPSGTDE
jgi:hypothetical protein